MVDGALTGVDLAALGDGLVQLDDVADFAPLADATLSSGATSFKTIKGNLAVTSVSCARRISRWSLRRARAGQRLLLISAAWRSMWKPV